MLIKTYPMKTTFFCVLSIVSFVVTLVGCDKDKSSDNIVTQTLNLDESYDYDTGDNKLISLGRVLFYDSHLSVNNSISCASCHKQAYGFADNVALSRGFENKLTSRNSIAIQNLHGNSLVFFQADSSKLFWDGRETMLPNMVLRPLLNHVEMGMGSLSSVVAKVKAQPYYENLFTQAFAAEDQINETNIGAALSSFTSAITSFNSKFDAFNRGTGVLTGKESFGRDLFFNRYNCNSCHQTQMPNGYQTGGGFVNIGLNSIYTDNGRGDLTNNAADNGKFKIPNLHNIALTAPYMHDGRFTTLSQVIDHYSTGITNHPNLDPRLKNGNNAAVLNITANEKDALITFLSTLTDYSLITDPKFSNPFKTK